ncbi:MULTISPECIES: glycosyltransferase family protein [Chromobacterium]|uniref:hypothetical protein n=1 Tax=Chromobacterium TaxID=535 RepID=UPI001887F414|nr:MULTISPECIES: hypothetical protein [Chromobacterium]WON82822.1 hypothetical protein OK026_16935 [Chromobacterium haemolyticum]
MGDKQAGFNFSMILPIYNEQERIGRVLDYYGQFGSVLVVDNCSNDESVTIAKNRGCTVVEVANKGSLQTPEWFRTVLPMVNNDYILLLSCSEFISFQVLKEFDRVAREGAINMVTTPIVSYTCGEDIQIWGGRFRNFERRTERFFNRKNLNYEAIFMHAPFETVNGGDVLHLESSEGFSIVHLRDSDIESLTRKHLNYALVEAEQMVASGKKISLLKLFNYVVSDCIRFVRLPWGKHGFISARELWARIMLHVTIYFCVKEIYEEKGIRYSRERSSALWQKLTKTQCSDN